LNCPVCAKTCDELLTVCGSCGSFTGFPNVRLAESLLETEALDSRYSDALISADGRNSLEALLKFEDAVRNSGVVVAMNVARLRSMATIRGELYSNYDLAVRASTRRPASTSNDQHRRTVDAKMWGVAASEIRYGALSLDGKGLSSYGICYVTLGDNFIAHRTSVLERNSFDFLEDVKIGEEAPAGFRSSWHSRYKVAVTKCEPRIGSGTASSDFPQVLLKPSTSRATDEFIEVHIYGPFDFEAFKSVRIADGPKTTADKVSLDIARQYVLKAGKTWV